MEFIKREKQTANGASYFFQLGEERLEGPIYSEFWGVIFPAANLFITNFSAAQAESDKMSQTIKLLFHQGDLFFIISK